MPPEDHRRRFALVISILAVLGLGIHLTAQSRRIEDLEAAQQRLERSRAASKLDSAERRDALSARLERLEAEIERLGWDQMQGIAEAIPRDQPPSEEGALPVTIPAEKSELSQEDLAQILETLAATSAGFAAEQAYAGNVPGRSAGAISELILAGSLPRGGTAQGNNPDAPSWSEAQATGAPDTEGLGDLPTAWASKRPDEGLEWLEIDFPPGITPNAVVIVESHNPGAVTRVEGGSGGSLQSLWSGTDPATEDANEFVISVPAGLSIETVRITLDTRRVSGWNEIDAVGLEVGDQVTWGIAARASSSYADR